jgi:hypothetical protein
MERATNVITSPTEVDKSVKTLKDELTENMQFLSLGGVTKRVYLIR